MEKTYSYIEVLLCLREEYLKNEMELKKLKELTELHDSKIADYYFRCVNNKLLLDREIIKSKLKKIIERIGSVIDLTGISECIKDESGNYIIKDGKYNAPIILNQNLFDEQADRILTSDFVKNATNRCIPVSNGNVNFTSSSIHIYINDHKNCCRYSAYDDCLHFQSVSKLNDSNLCRLLFASFPATKLNEWQREIIDKNFSQIIGNIIFPELEISSNSLNLGIEKKDQKVYLRQK